MGLLNFFFKSSKEKKNREMGKIRDQIFDYVEDRDFVNLIKALKSNHWFRRYCAAGGLMDLGRDSLTAFPNLLEVFLNDPHADVEFQAGRALLVLAPQRYTPFMEAATQKQYARKIFLLIDMVIPMGREGIPFLIELIKTDAKHLHLHCQSSIEQITGKCFETTKQCMDWYAKDFIQWYESQNGNNVDLPGFSS